MKKPDKQIESEIEKLETALKLPGRWNSKAREEIEQSITVLKERLSLKQVEDRYYQDESTEEYRDGDNDLWMELHEVAKWLAGEEVEAPSTRL